MIKGIGRGSVWRKNVSVSIFLWAVFSVCSLVFLNEVAAGSSGSCSWSLFSVWRGEIAYLSSSDTLMYDIGYLFVGGASKRLWLYTFLHLVPSVILGWAGAAIIAVACFLVRRKDAAKRTSN